MIERYSHFVVNHRIWIILLSLIVVVAAALGLPQSKFSSDYRVYFSEDNPHLKAFDELQAKFTKSDSVLFVIAPKDGQVFTPKTLALVEELTELAWQTPYSTRVDSITNYQHTIAEDDDLIVDNLITDALNRSPEELEYAKQVALSEPTVVKWLISEKADVTGINVSINLPGIDPSQETPEVAKYAYSVQETILKKYDHIDMHVAGQIIADNAFAEASMYDLSHIVPLAFLIALICIALYMYKASGSKRTLFSGTFATVIIIFASIAFAQGISAWLGIDITTASANAPTMILTLAVADSIHILASFFQQMQAGKDKHSAIIESLRINQQPVFLTSVTTMIGFLSLNFSDSPPFWDLGNIVAIGVVGAWLFSICLLPALIAILPFKVNAVDEQARSWPKRLANWIIKRYRVILVAMIAAMAVSISFLPRNELNDIWVEYFDPSMPARAAADFTRERLTGVGNVAFSIKSKAESGVTDPEYLIAIDKAANWLRQQPEILHVLSFSDVMKRLNKNMHSDDPSYYTLPNDPELAAQYLLLYEMSLPYGLDLNNQIDITKTETRLLCLLAKVSTADILALEERAAIWFKENVPEVYAAPGASGDVMFAHIGQSNIRSMLQGTFIALLIISAILAVSLRSFYYGAISLLPNLLPALVGFGIWGLFVGQIGLGLSVVFGMTLGIVVDYSVHFLSKFLRAKRENNLSTEDAIRYAFSTVGVALCVTTLILFANFSVLSISDFEMNADMGLMTAVTIVIALLVDFFFLPPLLLFLTEKKSISKQAHSSASHNQDNNELTQTSS